MAPVGSISHALAQKCDSWTRGISMARELAGNAESQAHLDLGVSICAVKGRPGASWQWRRGTALCQVLFPRATFLGYQTKGMLSTLPPPKTQPASTAALLASPKTFKKTRQDQKVERRSSLSYKANPQVAQERGQM